MAKRKRNDDVSNQHHEDVDEDDDEQQVKAVFVDTNIDTNIIVLISPFSSFSLLKERIVREHADCFPELGEIKISALKVKRDQKYYRFSERMLLRTAFDEVDTWFVFADVDKASLGQPRKTHSDPISEPQLTTHDDVSNLPNDPFKDYESKAVETGSNIGSPVAGKSLRHKKRKTEKDNNEDSSLALTSSLPAENVHKIENIIAVDKSLLETKGLVSGFEGEPLEAKQPVNQKDDLQKNDGASVNFPSKVVETATEGEVRTEEMRYSHPSTARHVHGASSELEGESRKNKKSGDGDGVDKIDSVKVREGPDVMPYDGAAGRESDRINTSIEETPLRRTDDSKFLLSRHEEVNKEDAPLMSSELKKNTEPRKASKKRRSSKAESEHQKGESMTSGETLKEVGREPRAKKTMKTNTKDVDGVDLSPQVLKSIQYDVTALDSEKAACERESNSKITAEEEILETGNIAKKKKHKTTETDQDLNDSRLDVAEILQQADISKPEQNPESANVTEETKVDKSKPSKKTKKSKKNEGEEQKVYSQETDMRNLVEQTTKKSKRKKPDQPSSMDTSPNLIAVEKGYESDVQEAGAVKVIGVESIHPQLSTPEVNGEITATKPKKVRRKHSASENSSSILHMKQQQDAETKKTADDVTSLSVNKKQTELKDGESRHLNENSVQKTKNNSKLNKPDQPSSIHTSSNLMAVEKGYESERTSLVNQQLQSDVPEAELVKATGVESFQPQVSTPEVNGKISSVKPKKGAQRKHSNSENSNSILHVQQQLEAKTQKTVVEVSSSLPETKIPEKPRVSKQKVKDKDVATSAVAESKEKNPTESTSLKEVTASQVPRSDTVNTRVGETGQNAPVKSSGTSSLISGKSGKTHMGKNLKEVQKRKNQENSHKTPSNKMNQETSFKTPSTKKNQETSFKTPSNKNVVLPVSSVPQKKQLPPISGGLFGGLYSDSSDGEIDRNGSNCSTRTPDDLSSFDYSSDYSEGESKGDVVTSQQKSDGSRSAREKTSLNLSAFKDQDIKSVLRSSRRFKNAKLAASQSQMEDGESEPPEFVPDSLPDS